MKILLLNQFYWPDGSATSQLLTDLTRRLAAAGHEVTVLCSAGEYAAADTTGAPPVKVERMRGFSFRRGGAGRLAAYLSYLAWAAWRGLRAPKPDVAITMTTPPGLPLVGAMLKGLRGVRHCIWEMDMYPDVALDVGYLRRESAAARALGAALDYPRRQADCVIALGECMAARLKARMPEAKIHIAENWAPEPDFPYFPPRLEGALRVLYSGNLGLAHDVETIAAAMEELREDDGFEFTFGGGGPGHELIWERCIERRILNARFLPYCAPSEHAARVAAYDIGLVTQKDACAGSVVPSKVYALLAAGRPYLYIGPAHATPGLLIERHGCGWQVACGDAAALVRVLRELREKPQLVTAAADRARALFVSRHERRLGVERVARIVEAVGEQAAEASAEHAAKSWI
jgi:colanic acid biosynthesis glycosyl transferase WcaI